MKIVRHNISTSGEVQDGTKAELILPNYTDKYNKSYTVADDRYAYYIKDINSGDAYAQLIKVDLHALTESVLHESTARSSNDDISEEAKYVSMAYVHGEMGTFLMYSYYIDNKDKVATHGIGNNMQMETEDPNNIDMYKMIYIYFIVGGGMLYALEIPQLPYSVNISSLTYSFELGLLSIYYSEKNALSRFSFTEGFVNTYEMSASRPSGIESGRISNIQTKGFYPVGTLSDGGYTIIKDAVDAVADAVWGVCKWNHDKSILFSHVASGSGNSLKACQTTAFVSREGISFDSELSSSDLTQSSCSYSSMEVYESKVYGSIVVTVFVIPGRTIIDVRQVLHDGGEWKINAISVLTIMGDDIKSAVFDRSLVDYTIGSERFKIYLLTNNSDAIADDINDLPASIYDQDIITLIFPIDTSLTIPDGELETAYTISNIKKAVPTTVKTSLRRFHYIGELQMVGGELCIKMQSIGNEDSIVDTILYSVIYDRFYLIPGTMKYIGDSYDSFIILQDLTTNKIIDTTLINMPLPNTHNIFLTPYGYSGNDRGFLQANFSILSHSKNAYGSYDPTKCSNYASNGMHGTFAYKDEDGEKIVIVTYNIASSVREIPIPTGSIAIFSLNPIIAVDSNTVVAYLPYTGEILYIDNIGRDLTTATLTYSDIKEHTLKVSDTNYHIDDMLMKETSISILIQIGDEYKHIASTNGYLHYTRLFSATHFISGDGYIGWFRYNKTAWLYKKEGATEGTDDGRVQYALFSPVDNIFRIQTHEMVDGDYEVTAGITYDVSDIIALGHTIDDYILLDSQSDNEIIPQNFILFLDKTANTLNIFDLKRLNPDKLITSIKLSGKTIDRLLAPTFSNSDKYSMINVLTTSNEVFTIMVHANGLYSNIGDKKYEIIETGGGANRQTVLDESIGIYGGIYDASRLNVIRDTETGDEIMDADFKATRGDMNEFRLLADKFTKPAPMTARTTSKLSASYLGEETFHGYNPARCSNMCMCDKFTMFAYQDGIIDKIIIRVHTLRNVTYEILLSYGAIDKFTHTNILIISNETAAIYDPIVGDVIRVYNISSDFSSIEQVVTSIADKISAFQYSYNDGGNIISRDYRPIHALRPGADFYSIVGVTAGSSCHQSGKEYEQWSWSIDWTSEFNITSDSSSARYMTEGTLDMWSYYNGVTIDMVMQGIAIYDYDSNTLYHKCEIRKNNAIITPWTSNVLTFDLSKLVELNYDIGDFHLLASSHHNDIQLTAPMVFFDKNRAAMILIDLRFFETTANVTPPLGDPQIHTIKLNKHIISSINTKMTMSNILSINTDKGVVSLNIDSDGIFDEISPPVIYVDCVDNSGDVRPDIDLIDGIFDVTYGYADEDCSHATCNDKIGAFAYNDNGDEKIIIKTFYDTIAIREFDLPNGNIALFGVNPILIMSDTMVVIYLPLTGGMMVIENLDYRLNMSITPSIDQISERVSIDKGGDFTIDAMYRGSSPTCVHIIDNNNFHKVRLASIVAGDIFSDPLTKSISSIDDNYSTAINTFRVTIYEWERVGQILRSLYDSSVNKLSLYTAFNYAKRGWITYTNNKYDLTPLVDAGFTIDDYTLLEPTNDGEVGDTIPIAILSKSRNMIVITDLRYFNITPGRIIPSGEVPRHDISLNIGTLEKIIPSTQRTNGVNSLNIMNTDGDVLVISISPSIVLDMHGTKVRSIMASSAFPIISMPTNNTRSIDIKYNEINSALLKVRPSANALFELDWGDTSREITPAFLNDNAQDTQAVLPSDNTLIAHYALDDGNAIGGVIAQYNFNNNKLDSSGNGHHSTSGSPTFSEKGINGMFWVSTLYNEYFPAQTKGTLAFNGEFTDVVCSVLDGWASGRPHIFIRRVHDGLQCAAHVNNTYTAHICIPVSNECDHYALVWDFPNEIFKGYVNGVEVVSAITVDPTTVLTQQTFGIGTAVSDVYINNVVLFDYPLLADELKQLCKNPSNVERNVTSIPTDYVRRLRLDGDALDSKGTNHGNVASAVTFGQGRRERQSAIFKDDDDSYIICGEITGTKVTVSCRFYADQIRINTGIHWNSIFCINTAVGGNRILLGQEGDGKYQININDKSADAGNVPLKTWTLLTLVIDGAIVKIYENEKLIQTVLDFTGLDAGDILILGAEYDAVDTINDHFIGRMEDLLIYNRALSINEVAILAEKSQTVLDSSGKNNHIVTNTPLNWAEGVEGNALTNFRNSGSISLDRPLIDVSMDFSISLWVKPSDGDKGMLLSHGQYDLGGFFIGRSSVVYVRCCTSGNFVDAGSTMKINDGRYHHIVFTYDATSYESILYIDNIEQDAVILPFPMKPIDRPFIIGGYNVGESYLIGDSVDEIQVYSKVVNKYEVSGLYNRLSVSDEYHRISHAYATSGDKDVKILYPSDDLGTLNCSTSSVSELDISNAPELFSLDCGVNKITSLDLSNNVGLGYLYCPVNNMSILDVSYSPSIRLVHAYNIPNLSSFVATSCALLYELHLYSNKLASIDISTNVGLITLRVDNNTLTSLVITNNTKLNSLMCDSNNISALDISTNTALEILKVNHNNLTAFDITNNQKLRGLNLSYNSLTALTMSNNDELEYLNVEHNNLATGAMDSIIDELLAGGVSNGTLVMSCNLAIPSIDKMTALQAKGWDLGNIGDQVGPILGTQDTLLYTWTGNDVIPTETVIANALEYKFTLVNNYSSTEVWIRAVDFEGGSRLALNSVLIKNLDTKNIWADEIGNDQRAWFKIKVGLIIGENTISVWSDSTDTGQMRDIRVVLRG